MIKKIIMKILMKLKMKMKKIQKEKNRLKKIKLIIYKMKSCSQNQ